MERRPKLQHLLNWRDGFNEPNKCIHQVSPSTIIIKTNYQKYEQDNIYIDIKFCVQANQMKLNLGRFNIKLLY